MKLTRVITYEGPEADIRRHLESALLSWQSVVRPGDNVPYIGPIHAQWGAPQVTISLVEQREECEERD